MPEDTLDLALMREWFDVREARDLVVYHYTDAAGLLGIVSSGVIRGTNAAFLNDRGEIAHGLEVCEEVLQEEIGARAAGADRVFLERVWGWIKDGEAPNEVYVSSFTTRRDSLSQWRGYGSSVGRYAIGFRVAGFSERDFLRLPMAVSYVPEEQREKVRRILGIALAGVASSDESTARRMEGTTALHLRRVMCTLKHHAFADEQEYRSVSTIASDGSDSPSLDFAVSGEGVLKPWLPMLTGSRESQRLPIVEVQVGHVSRPSEAAFSTRLLLDQAGYVDVKVSQTEIPFIP